MSSYLDLTPPRLNDLARGETPAASVPGYDTGKASGWSNEGRRCAVDDHDGSPDI